MKTTDNWLRDGLDILNPRKHPLTDEAKANLKKLCGKLQLIQNSYGHHLICNSGYRSPKEQLQINPRAPNSWHTKGAAIDVADREGLLWQWLNMHNPLFDKGLDGHGVKIPIANAELHDVYLEDRSATPTWVHIQLYAPKSGKRIFKP